MRHFGWFSNTVSECEPILLWIFAPKYQNWKEKWFENIFHKSMINKVLCASIVKSLPIHFGTKKGEARFSSRWIFLQKKIVKFWNFEFESFPGASLLYYCCHPTKLKRWRKWGFGWQTRLKTNFWRQNSNTFKIIFFLSGKWLKVWKGLFIHS